MSSLNETTKAIPGGTAPLNTQDNHSSAHFVNADFAGASAIVTVFPGYGYLRSVRVNVTGASAVKVRDGAVTKAVVGMTVLGEILLGITIQESLILEQVAGITTADITVEFIKP